MGKNHLVIEANSLEALQGIEGVPRFLHVAHLLEHDAHLPVDFSLTKAVLVSSLMPGENLRTLVARHGRFHEIKVLEIALQLTSILHECHERGLRHGDLKMSNVMHDPVTTQTAIIDWDLSAHTDIYASARVVGRRPFYYWPHEKVAIPEDYGLLKWLIYGLDRKMVPVPSPDRLPKKVIKKGKAASEDYVRDHDEKFSQMMNGWGALFFKYFTRIRKKDHRSSNIHQKNPSP